MTYNYRDGRCRRLDECPICGMELGQNYGSKLRIHLLNEHS